MLTCDWPFRFHLITGDPCVGGSETGCVNMLKYGSTVLQQPILLVMIVYMFQFAYWFPVFDSTYLFFSHLKKSLLSRSFDIAMSYRRRNPIWNYPDWCSHTVAIEWKSLSGFILFLLILLFGFRCLIISEKWIFFQSFIYSTTRLTLHFVHIIAFEPTMFSARKNSSWLFAFANSFSFTFRLTTFRFYQDPWFHLRLR